MELIYSQLEQFNVFIRRKNNLPMTQIMIIVSMQIALYPCCVRMVPTPNIENFPEVRTDDPRSFCDKDSEFWM